MPRVRISLEDVLAVDEAIDMVQKEDSNDILDIAAVKGYQEQLDEMREAKQGDEAAVQDANQQTDDDENEESEKADEAPLDIEDANKDLDNEVEPGEPTLKDKEEINEEAKEALENLQLTLDIHTALLRAKRSGSTREVAVEKYKGPLKKIAKAHNLSLTPVLALESLSPNKGYVRNQKALAVALEGVGEWLKAAAQKVVEVIKTIIKWLKDFFFYDPVKERETQARMRTMEDMVREADRKAKALSSYERNADAAFTRKRFTARSAQLMAGRGDQTFDEVMNNVMATFNVLSQYWTNTERYVTTNVIPKFRDVSEFVASNGTSFTYDPDAIRSDVLNVSLADYAPVKLVHVTSTRSYTNVRIPNGFILVTSTALLCGNQRLMFVIPEKPLQDPMSNTRNGQNYYAGFALDEFSENVNRPISYTMDATSSIPVLKKAKELSEKRRQLASFIDQLTASLDKAARELIKFVSDQQNTGGQLSTGDRNLIITKIRFNINVLNNLFDKPLSNSLRYFKSLSLVLTDLVTANTTQINDYLASLENKKKDLQST